MKKLNPLPHNQKGGCYCIDCQIIDKVNELVQWANNIDITLAKMGEPKKRCIKCDSWGCDRCEQSGYEPKEDKCEVCGKDNCKTKKRVLDMADKLSKPSSWEEEFDKEFPNKSYEGIDDGWTYYQKRFKDFIRQLLKKESKKTIDMDRYVSKDEIREKIDTG